MDSADTSLWMTYQIVEDDNKELRKIIRGLITHLSEYEADNDICKLIKNECVNSFLYNYYYLENRDYQDTEPYPN